jgi:hypothetical protein
MGAALLVALGLTALASAAGPRRTLRETLVGAQIVSRANGGEAVYKVTSNLDGHGAAVQEVTVSGTSFPLSGTDRVTTYYANGVGRSRDKFTLSVPNAAGISTITGTGRCTGGTRVHRHEQCSYTFTGVFNTRTNAVSARVRGTVTR